MKRLLTLSLMLLATTIGGARTRADVVRTVYFSAVDAGGAFVTDLTAADLTVKEGGKDRTIDVVKAASMPMQLSILVDDGGTGGFQAAVAQFIQTTFGRAEFAMRILSPQAIKVMDFTRDADELRTVIGRLGQRGKIPNDGEQIIAGVFEAATELRQRKARRGAIIALTVTGEKALSDQAQEALNALKSSGASLSVVYLTGVRLGEVLGDGPKQSGGMIEQANGSGVARSMLAKVADNLLHQYVLTYTVPDGVKLNEKLALSTTRRGVKLIAPTTIPDK